MLQKLLTIAMMLLGMSPSLWAVQYRFDFEQPEQAEHWSFISYGLDYANWQRGIGYPALDDPCQAPTACITARGKIYWSEYGTIELNTYSLPNDGVELSFAIKVTYPRLRIHLGSAFIYFEPNTHVPTPGPGGGSYNNFTLQAGQWVSVHIQIDANVLNLWIDDTHVIVDSDWSPYLASKGNVFKLQAWHGDETTYNNLVLDDFVLEIMPVTCTDVQQQGSILPGDVNGDCFVDLQDFAILADAWLMVVY